MVGTWITHLFGGSAGREGVAVQIGATFSHAFGKYLSKYIGFKFSKRKKIIISTGMAAGFAGLFGTPMAATIFALEVISIWSCRVHSVVSSINCSIYSLCSIDYAWVTTFAR